MTKEDLRVAAKKLGVVTLHKMLANIQHQQIEFKLCQVAVYARDNDFLLAWT